MGQSDRGGAAGRAGFVAAQPCPFRGRDAGHRNGPRAPRPLHGPSSPPPPAPASLRGPSPCRPAAQAPPGPRRPPGELRGLRRGPHVVPEHRRPHRVAVRIQGHQAVLLRPDGDRGDLSGQPGLGKRLREGSGKRVPPLDRIALPRASVPVTVCGAVPRATTVPSAASTRSTFVDWVELSTPAASRLVTVGMLVDRPAEICPHGCLGITLSVTTSRPSGRNGAAMRRARTAQTAGPASYHAPRDEPRQLELLGPPELALPPERDGLENAAAAHNPAGVAHHAPARRIPLRDHHGVGEADRADPGPGGRHRRRDRPGPAFPTSTRAGVVSVLRRHLREVRWEFTDRRGGPCRHPGCRRWRTASTSISSQTEAGA